MAEPVDAIRALHNAFRNDMEHIDAAALASARGTEGLAATVERFRFFNEVLAWHAHGEELAIFPVLEDVAPLVAEAYVKDHRGLDSAFDELSKSYAARDPLTTARATAAFRFHLNIHLVRRIPTSTPTSTGFSPNESPYPSKGRRLVSCPARFPRSGFRKWWRGCSR
jgi:hypothetical protein